MSDDLKSALQRKTKRMQAILDGARGRTFTFDEREELKKLEKEASEIERSIKVKSSFAPGEGCDLPKGSTAELLRPDQRVSDWFEARGGAESPGSDFDYSAMWRQLSGRTRPGAEMRALGEDTTSGSGAAAAIVPQNWATSVLDLTRENLVLNAAGMRTFVMPSEQYHYPLYNQDITASWIAENTALTPDTNPQFTDLLFNATGAFADVTLVSFQTLEDQSVDLDSFLKNMIAQRHARKLEQVALYGQTGSGTPGLANETGLLTSGTAAPAGFGANGGSPTDFSQTQIGIEAVRKTNLEPSAVLVNPQTYGTYGRLEASSYAKFWDWNEPMDAKRPDGSVVPWLYSTTLAGNETQGTGTNLSSVWIGDWSRLLLGMHVDVKVITLTERYAEFLQVGFLSYMRYCVRAAIPTSGFNKPFYRLTGCVTS